MVGIRSREWTAVAESEEAVVRELMQCREGPPDWQHHWQRMQASGPSGPSGTTASV